MKNTPNWGQDNLHVNADEETSSSTDCEEKVLTVMGIMFAHRTVEKAHLTFNDQSFLGQT